MLTFDNLMLPFMKVICNQMMRHTLKSHVFHTMIKYDKGQPTLSKTSYYKTLIIESQKLRGHKIQYSS